LYFYVHSLANPTQKTFTGKELDEETGRYYFGARYYDAALGRWSVTDPAGQFASPYAYAGNPVSYVDPDGEFVLPVLAAMAYGATIGATVSTVTYSAVALTTGNFSWKGLGQSALAGGIGGAFSGGFGHFATSLGSFGQSLGYNTLSNTATFTASTLATGGELTAGTIAGSFAGGLVGGTIPGFSGVEGGWASNATAELAYSAVKGSVTGGLSGATAAAIDGQNIGQGYIQGTRSGAIGNTVSSALLIASLEPARTPPPHSQDDLDWIEDRMARGGLQAGRYKPVYRRGGIYSLFTDRGVTWGRNLVVPDNEPITYRHEAIHYYQQIRDGFAGFQARSIWEIGWLEWIKGQKVYTTPGTQENQVEQLLRFYGF